MAAGTAVSGSGGLKLHVNAATNRSRDVDGEAVGAICINELARLLGRNYKNVHTNVTRLVELGYLIERVQDQRIAVAWDAITVEMKLAA